MQEKKKTNETRRVPYASTKDGESTLKFEKI